MDLGIEGHKEIVCASSRGRGRGCAFAPARAGVDVMINRRELLRAEPETAEVLQQTHEAWARQQLLYYVDSAAHRRYAPPGAPDVAIGPAAGG